MTAGDGNMESPAIGNPHVPVVDGIRSDSSVMQRRGPFGPRLFNKNICIIHWRQIGAVKRELSANLAPAIRSGQVQSSPGGPLPSDQNRQPALPTFCPQQLPNAGRKRQPYRRFHSEQTPVARAVSLKKAVKRGSGIEALPGDNQHTQWILGADFCRYNGQLATLSPQTDRPGSQAP